MRPAGRGCAKPRRLRKTVRKAVAAVRGAGLARRMAAAPDDRSQRRSMRPTPPPCPWRVRAVAAPLQLTRVAAQYQEDLPPVRPIVRAFHVHIGECQQCGRRVQGRHLLQTSDALGAAAAQLGPVAVATAAHLHKECGLPLGKIVRFYQEHFGLTVTPGGLVHALHRAARQATPTYDALREMVRQRPIVVPDETGWRVGGELHWLWVAATSSETVYAVHRGRGFDEAAALLGADFAGVLVRDGWAPYRQFAQAAHQTCLAHLCRRCHELQTDHPRVGTWRRAWRRSSTNAVGFQRSGA
jgi:transposase